MSLTKTIATISLIGSTLAFGGCYKKEVPELAPVISENLTQKEHCESDWLFHGRVDKYDLEQRKQILIINGEDPSLYDSTCITSRAERLFGTDRMSLHVQAAALRLTSDDLYGSKTDSLEYERNIINYNSRVDAFNKKYGFLFQNSTKQ